MPRPRDAEVAEPAGDERSRLVEAEVGAHEVGPRVVKREQLVLVRREAEEPVRLLDPLRRHEVVRAQAVGSELLFSLERLAADAVEARVDVLVDVAVVVDPLQEVADELLVPVVARADEEVDLGVEPLWELTPRHGDPVGVLLRGEPLLLRDAPDLRRVLVYAREEERVRAALTVEADENVANRGRVRMPDVRRRVDVVDRRREVEAHPSMIRGPLTRLSTLTLRFAVAAPFGRR